MKKVLVTASHYDKLCAQAKQLLIDNGFEVIQSGKELPYLSYEELAKFAPDIDAAIVGLDIWSEDVFKIAPKLKVVAKFGVGVDTIDLQAAKKYGIKVINAHGKNSDSVAELCMAFILNGLREIVISNPATHKGDWKRYVGYELKGKTVGLIGFGDIAQKLARKLSGFDVDIIAYDICRNEEKAKELNVKWAGLDELLKKSDVVSLHIPGLPENHNIISRERIAAMKNGAYLVNAARGNLVDEEAMVEAIKSGRLFGAALDVYQQEPLKADDPIAQVDRIICAPHSGAETFEAYTAVSMSTAQGVIDVINGVEPKNWVNR